MVFGHAKDGNLHFLVNERFDDPVSLARYQRSPPTSSTSCSTPGVPSRPSTARAAPCPVRPAPVRRRPLRAHGRGQAVVRPAGVAEPRRRHRRRPGRLAAPPQDDADRRGRGRPLRRVRVLRTRLPQQGPDPHPAPAHRAAPGGGGGPRPWRRRARGLAAGGLRLRGGADLRRRRAVRAGLPGGHQHRGPRPAPAGRAGPRAAGPRVGGGRSALGRRDPGGQPRAERRRPGPHPRRAGRHRGSRGRSRAPTGSRPTAQNCRAAGGPGRASTVVGRPRRCSSPPARERSSARRAVVREPPRPSSRSASGPASAWPPSPIPARPAAGHRGSPRACARATTRSCPGSRPPCSRPPAAGNCPSSATRPRARRGCCSCGGPGGRPGAAPAARPRRDAVRRRPMLDRLPVTRRLGSLVLHPTCSPPALGVLPAMVAVANTSRTRWSSRRTRAAAATRGDRGLLHPS